jgi:hypothetical protein
VSARVVVWRAVQTHRASYIERAACLLGVCWLGACTSAWNESGPPFSRAETDRALAPVQRLEARCYAGSSSARAKQPVRFVFMLYVDGQGQVHAEPKIAEPSVPEMIECVRHQLDTLRFPAKGKSDQVQLDFEFGSKPERS